MYKLILVRTSRNESFDGSKAPFFERDYKSLGGAKLGFKAAIKRLNLEGYRTPEEFAREFVPGMAPVMRQFQLVDHMTDTYQGLITAGLFDKEAQKFVTTELVLPILGEEPAAN